MALCYILLSYSRLCVRVGMLFGCREHQHCCISPLREKVLAHCISSLREEGWAHCISSLRGGFGPLHQFTKRGGLGPLHQFIKRGSLGPLYQFTKRRFIEVPVPSQQSEGSCICVLWISIQHLSANIQTNVHKNLRRSGHKCFDLSFCIELEIVSVILWKES